MIKEVLHYFIRGSSYYYIIKINMHTSNHSLLIICTYVGEVPNELTENSDTYIRK